MTPLTIAHVLGARPQFIKYFPVQQACAPLAAAGRIDSRVLHTGQHYDYRMSKIFFDELGIRPPDVHLEVGSGPHGQQTGRVLERVEAVLKDTKPDLVVVYGDTNSTLGGALAAAKLHIPVAHVEAGLRSRRKHMPEEINRVLTDHVSTFLFCPSDTAVSNLAREGLSRDAAGRMPPDADRPQVVLAGDVMYDVLLHSVEIAKHTSRILEQLCLAPQEYTLLTLHRAENTDDPGTLAHLVQFINDVTSGPVIFPMHPRTAGVYGTCGTRLAERIRVIEPLGHFDLVTLLSHARAVFTDSGGMQKEAYWLRVPCVTLRDETEWVETIESGWNTLYRDFPSDRPRHQSTSAYGDGRAAHAMVSSLVAAYAGAVDACCDEARA